MRCEQQQHSAFSVVSITQNSRGCASLMTAGAPCFIVMSGCASGKQYSTFVQTVVKSGSKVNMFCISIIIRAVHHLAYDSLMIFVYSGHNYSADDAAPTWTVVLKWKSEVTVANNVFFINDNGKNRPENLIGWIISEISIIIWLVFRSRSLISSSGVYLSIYLFIDQFFLI